MRIPIAIILVTLLPNVCAAELLGTATAAGRLGSSVQAPHRVLPWFFYTISPGAILFNEVWVDRSSIGTIQTATPSSGPDFVEIANRLVNGRVEDISIGATLESVGGGDIESEQSWFGLDSRDFKGALIDSIVFRVDALEFEDPNEIGGTTFAFTFTVFVHGRDSTVPVEPATWGRIKALYDDVSAANGD